MRVGALRKGKEKRKSQKPAKAQELRENKVSFFLMEDRVRSHIQAEKETVKPMKNDPKLR